MLIRIDPEKCTRCGACVADCPIRIVRMTEPGPMVAEDDAPLCIACGHCVAVCPEAALDHAAMTAATCPPVDRGEAFTPEQAAQFLRARRSIRQYRERSVEPEVLVRLLRLASWAPSGHNSQPVEWLVLSGPSEVRRMSGLVADWMRWLETAHPETFRLLHLDRVLGAAARGEDRILRGAPHLIVAHAPKDSRVAPAAAITALAYLELAATSLDLGTCWAGYFSAAAAVFTPLQEALALPDGHGTLGAAMVGYPVVRYSRIPLRREPRISWRHGHSDRGAPGA
ncbi:MAG: nitroreductase family protein [Deltaproteobacteria bacterium]|nr:nitroreductase family protein [Deltaproteobacteria bacterium]